MFYFLMESLAVFVLMAWGASFHFEPAHLLWLPLISRVCAYEEKGKMAFSFASLKKYRSEILTALFFIMATLMLLKGYAPHLIEMSPQSWMMYAVSPFVVFSLRMGYQSFVKSEPSGIPVLVVGSGEDMSAFKKAAYEYDTLGYQMHYFDSEAVVNDDTCETLRYIVSKHKIKQIVIAADHLKNQSAIDLLLSFRIQGIEMRGMVSFYEQVFGKIWIESIKQRDLIFGGGFKRQAIISLTKRMIDISAAVLGLVLSAPLFLLLPILIKYDSKGSVFYKQERIGEKGQPFTILKFRSMCQDAEIKTGAVWATENDPRVTPIGKLMRKMRLDELPQLINILRGEMSFVGPRPERQVFVDALEKKVPFYGLRHSVKPGLTGWAQVRYRYGSSEEDALAKHHFDLYYVKHLSPLFDLSIIFATIRVVLIGKGAR